LSGSLFQSGDPQLQPLVIGGGHGRDAGQHAKDRHEKGGRSSASSSAAPMNSTARPPKAVIVCMSHRMTGTVANPA
jgi:hypothetical protein